MAGMPESNRRQGLIPMNTTSKAILSATLIASLAFAAAPVASADPGVSVCPKYIQQCLLTAYVTEDGAVCFYFSSQVPTCTPDGVVSVDGFGLCIRGVQCILTVYFTDDSVCFYISEQVPTCISLA